jgi:uncharacterized protein YdeI (YjbR/CyaY-like superfamily)
MTSRGLETIELAKRNGTWTALNKIENLKLPIDLKKALKQMQKRLNILMPFHGL